MNMQLKNEIDEVSTASTKCDESTSFVLFFVKIQAAALGLVEPLQWLVPRDTWC